MGRQADEALRSQQLAGHRHRKTVAAKMHAFQIEGQDQIDPIVHEEGNGTACCHGLHCFRQCDQFERRKVAFTNLNSLQTSLNRMAEKRGERPSLRLLTISNEEEAKIYRRHRGCDRSAITTITVPIRMTCS